jgi:hypothetical protein
MKTLIIILFISISNLTYAQFPQTSASSDRIEAEASNLTDAYNKQLALTGVQLPLFKGVVEEYMKKSDKVIEQLDGREELNALVELQARETLEMNDILTQLQYRLYKKIKYELQPLKTVDKK